MRNKVHKIKNKIQLCNFILASYNLQSAQERSAPGQHL